MLKLYYHNGSDNHGCEAIVRATAKLLGSDEIILYSRRPETEKKYNLDEIVTVYDDSEQQLPRYSVRNIVASMYRRIFHNNYLSTVFKHGNFFSELKKTDVCFSIGGDNYCYAGRDILGHYNTRIHRTGAKTVLWGCSFEPDDMTDAIAEDISHYDLITARESITYQLLKKYNENTILVPDPAFLLDTVELPLPKNFLKNNTVGINLSPLVIKCESQKGAALQNYLTLIQYILDHTEMNVALIPHVVAHNNDDRDALRELSQYFGENERIVFIQDCNCMELKGYIARCRFFVGARTHATIGAYSSCVPTLVVGYSVKAKGIATDLFGNDRNYVLPVQALKDSNDLLRAFQWMQDNENKIRTRLESIMPNYKRDIWKVLDSLKTL
ncbi:MAG: polysaccharide pyruvyl transferase family protein [Clostridiales bacterium]|nr:polysaccharide pyruvyl transferase family protein [Clostridiales bacterium]